MTLIKSISGIRGTIGGKSGEGLNPVDAARFAAAYAAWLVEQHPSKKIRVVVGRDARISGPMIQQAVISALQGMGVTVLLADLSTTPTVEMAVVQQQAQGGIILTASHNPRQWNALKLLNNKGEFVSAADGARILDLADSGNFSFAEVDDLGQVIPLRSALQEHIDAILALPYVNAKAIQNAKFKVAIDAVNSSGGVAIPALLDALGVAAVEKLYCDPTGDFPHNPEPLEQHLGDIMSLVREKRCDLGIVVDPDVDRLALIDEKGAMFGEEYTLVACADYLLAIKPGPTVSNLSSSRALRDLTRSKGQTYTAAAVGEVNVVTEMKRTQAVIGGEGNGGIILPDLHYGRDALVGVALILSHLATSGKRLSELKSSYPAYFMAKEKIELTPQTDVDGLLAKVAEHYSKEEVSTLDGVKVDFEEGWVHLRKSNTEPIIRVYSEGKSPEKAKELAESMMSFIQQQV